MPQYAPIEYTAPVVAKGPVWADKPEQLKYIHVPTSAHGLREMKFNALDGKLNRTSHEGNYLVDATTGLPRLGALAFGARVDLTTETLMAERV